MLLGYGIPSIHVTRILFSSQGNVGSVFQAVFAYAGGRVANWLGSRGTGGLLGSCCANAGQVASSPKENKGQFPKLGSRFGTPKY